MMAALADGIDNITVNGGIGIAVTGMLIVIVALVIISIFIAVLPRVLAALDRLLGRSATTHPKPDEAAIVAAIGAALHHERQRGR